MSYCLWFIYFSPCFFRIHLSLRFSICFLLPKSPVQTTKHYSISWQCKINKTELVDNDFAIVFVKISFAIDCEKSVFSSKIRGEEHKTSKRAIVTVSATRCSQSRITLTVRFARLLVLIFEEKSHCSQSTFQCNDFRLRTKNYSLTA